jgi:alginate O-acetyltransferase complex protein AlgI
MDAEAFLTHATGPTKPNRATWVFAGLKTTFGVMLLWGAARWAMPYGPAFAAWIGLIGLVFTLHFGLFHLLALAWQTAGVDARPIMNWPIGAASVSDFWGNRWNRAFRQLAHQFLYRPLCGRVGPPMASGAAFLVSGLVHDAVISIPAGGGFGLPTIYFLIQFAGMSIERSPLGRRLGIRRGIAGQMFAVIVVVAPIGLLFHSPFMQRVVLPMFATIGALN